MNTHDKDLDKKDYDWLMDEVQKLRDAIRHHRDSSGHELCWYHPELWNLLPEHQVYPISVPPVCEFIENCIKYRQSLEQNVTYTNGGTPPAAELRQQWEEGEEQI